MSLAPALLLWLQLCAAAYDVEWEFAYAVIMHESGGRADLETAKYVGLFCLHKGYVREKFGLTAAQAKDPVVNIAIGVRALQGRDKQKILRRFNPSPGQEAYRRGVLRYYRQLKRQRRG